MGFPLQWPLLLWSTGSRAKAHWLWFVGSAVMADGLCYSAACGILPDQRSNPRRPLHWQEDPPPLSHQGSPTDYILKKLNSTSLMGIDEGCCSSIFTLFRSLDGGQLCVLETQQDLYLFCSPTSSERSPSSSAPCIMTLPLASHWCLHPLPLLGHPHARRLSPVFRAQLGPPLYNTPQGPRLSLTLCLHLSCSLCLDHFPLISPPFVTNSTVSPLENLHWPLPPTPEDTGVFPRLCPHSCEQTAGTELLVQCRREAHVRFFVRLWASSSLAPNTVLGAG